MHVKGWVKSTLLDYPGKIAVALFCGGCNFRCPNCHNAELVLDPQDIPDLPEDQIWDLLRRRQGFLDGVVISGGEPTLQSDLAAFARRARALGYAVKLDTNGYRPDVLEDAIAGQWVDYVAMDVKAPLDKYDLLVGVTVDTRRIERSIGLLLDSSVEYEFRTTVVPSLLVEDDIVRIAQQIAGARVYYLQQFVAHNTIDPDMLSLEPYLPERLRSMADLARPWVREVGVRGV
ncbi:MAG: anaerobic ribonucleoside-triphosphate reductase activating protein [Anaerolineae bacterium]|nr:anaerobic ribonucleoside-triphosphate reductase activating protein [Anaerolineae bacterium]